MTIGKRIEFEREKQNLTQDFLKTKAGISLDTLRRYEKDKVKNHSLYVVEAIEKALNIKFER